jgi:Holliday junction DNA helicase RuvA
MIAFVKGSLFSKKAGEAVVDCGGVGYLCYISMKTYDKLPEIADSVFLYTLYITREDATLLYGFKDESELELFKLLISVTGVGPKSALGILSSISPNDLSKAILNSDYVKIQKLPGIGKKSAERLVLELKDKITKISDSIDSIDNSISVASNFSDEAIAALTSLGYSRSIAEKAVKFAENDLSDNSSHSIERLIKLALKYAMK